MQLNTFCRNTLLAVTLTAGLMATSASAVTSTATSSGSTIAAGATMAWNVRADYGARDFRRLSPEMFGLYYIPITHDFFLRPGVRFGYTNLQPEMPKAVRIEENDTTVAAEIGALYDWIVVPSLTLGYGMDFRTIQFKTKEPMDAADEKISGSERLPYWTAQIGVGLPVMRGLFLAEPFARYISMKGDDRVQWTFGIDVSVKVH